MRFEYIEIHNYRPYVLEKINFGKNESHRNFTIIQGPNGAGKSSFLNAITWCLYNEEIHLKERLQGLPIFNTDAFQNCKIDGIVEVKVELQLMDKIGDKHTFSRALKFRKKKDGSEEKIIDPSSKEKDGSTFEYWRQNELLNDPVHYREQMLPSNIKEYFFFDGERLDDYFKAESGEKIKVAVFDISQITIVQKAIDRLEKRKKELLAEHAGDLDPQIEKLRGEIEHIDEKIRSYENDLEKNKEDRKKAEDIEKTYRKELHEHPDTTNLEASRRKKEEALERILENIKYFGDQKLNDLLKSSYSILAYKAMKTAKTLIDKGIIEGYYPPDAKKDFVESLLKNNKCICGVDLADHKYRKNVEDLLKRISTSSDVTNEIIRMQSSLRIKLDALQTFDQVHVDLSKNIRDLEIQSDSIDREIEQIKKQIGSSPLGKIRMLEDNLDKVSAVKESKIEKIYQLEAKISTEQNRVKILSDKLDRLLKQNVKHTQISLLNEFLSNSIESLKGVKDDIMKQVKEKIDENTKKQFFDLVWNPTTFQNVVIDGNYNMSVVHASGREGFGTLSAGQRQVLALSFMAALKTVSGFDMPIIIDTPLGRISREPKNNIAKRLPSYLEGCQVIMLMTEEEYTSEVRDKLRERVEKEYRIILETPSHARLIPYE